LITVNAANKLIRNITYKRKEIFIPIEHASEEILAEDIIADRDFPPYDRVMMDGIAVKLQTSKKSIRYFIEGIQKPGKNQKTLKNPDNCLEVMTGAILPKNCNCVIPYECLDIVNNTARVKISYKPKTCDYIHKKGSDAKKNEKLIPIGETISPIHTAIAASVGKSKVKIFAKPQIAILGTGDELIPIANTPSTHQIRQSNIYSIESALKLNGFSCNRKFHSKDKKDLLKNKIYQLSQEFDVLIITGAVSMGKFDFIPGILKELKANIIVYKIKQRPGKPFLFARLHNKLIFALPGNPVSSLLCTLRYVLPFLLRTKGRAQFLPIKSAITPNKKLTLFIGAKKQESSKGYFIKPIYSHNSGDLISLKDADGFIEIPPSAKEFKPGSLVKFIPWKL